MKLFSFYDNYYNPGPGVPDDAPRKTGLPRIWELLTRDFTPFWLSGVLNLLTTVPFFWGVGYACATHSILFALLVGVLGGVIAAPGFYGLADTLLRSLRDEAGFWWYRYSRALGKSWKSTLLPGALLGVVFAIQIFILMHMALLGGLGLFVCQLVSMVVSTGVLAWSLPQLVLVELSFPALVKNTVLLFLRYIPKTLAAAGILLVYGLLIVVTFPASVFLLLVIGLWLPLLLVFQVLYPTMDELFGIEATLNPPKERNEEDEEYEE